MFPHSLQKFDWVLALCAYALSAIGLAAIYSVDLSLGSELALFKTQLTALIIGSVIFFAASALHISVFEQWSKAAFVLACVLLAAVLLWGATVRGTTGWFRLGSVSFQPAEFAKVALILFLAWRIERQARQCDRASFALITGIITAIPAGLILVQPDLGSAAILFAIWFGLIIIAGTRARSAAGIIGVGITAAVFAWFFIFADYQKSRLLSFMHPERDPLGAGYNVAQSIIAVGSGGVLGRGLGFGSQSQLHFLPESQTDFIFSVIAEELGFVGVLIVLLLYALVLYRLTRIALSARGDFAGYTALGVAVLFVAHIIINIGGAVGLLPITGVTLPLLSYGGSSLIINFLLLGIAQSAARGSY